MDFPTTSSGYSITNLVIWLIVSLLASNTTSVLVTNWINRKNRPVEREKSEAETDAAKTESTRNVAETLKLVSEQLRETNEALRDAQVEISHKAFLEAEVERARNQGFLKRESEGGSGPNPAA